jgi:cobalt-zinc-cadmium efflux system protein
MHPETEATRTTQAAGDRAQSRRRLAITLGLVLAYMVAEAVGGLLTNSLALLADAGHMLSDAAALALSLFALWIAQKPSTPRRTFGYHRAEILAALANGAALGAIALFIVVEAIERLQAPAPVLGGPVMAIASGGLALNLVSLHVLGHEQESLNVRAAWLHVLSDAFGSVGALASGACIWAFGWTWADPLASVLIAVLVLYSSWKLLQETVAVLMEGVPRGIDTDQVRKAIHSMPGVSGVHDLHVWTITSGLVAMSGHIAVESGKGGAGLLHATQRMLHERFGIAHATIQLEPVDFRECRLEGRCEPNA